LQEIFSGVTIFAIHFDKYLKNCGSVTLKLWNLKLRITGKIAIAELQLRSNISLKVAELPLRKYVLQVAGFRVYVYVYVYE
jgi:hypothetical protein